MSVVEGVPSVSKALGSMISPRGAGQGSLKIAPLSCWHNKNSGHLLADSAA
jgi:hypothetical protein